MEGAFFFRAALQLGQPTRLFLLTAAFFLTGAQFILGWTKRRRARGCSLQPCEVEIHPQLLEFSVAGHEFFLKLQLRILRGGLQGGDLCRQCVDCFRSSRILWHDRIGRISEFFDLGLQGFQLGEQFCIGLRWFRLDDHHLGIRRRGRDEGFNLAKAIAFKLELVWRGRRESHLFFGLREEIEDSPANCDKTDDEESKQR